jgi:hypothetical protein
MAIVLYPHPLKGSMGRLKKFVLSNQLCLLLSIVQLLDTQSESSKSEGSVNTNSPLGGLGA